MKFFVTMLISAAFITGSFIQSQAETVSAANMGLWNDPQGDFVDFRDSSLSREKLIEALEFERKARRKTQRQLEERGRNSRQLNAEIEQLEKVRQAAVREQAEASRLGAKVGAAKRAWEGKRAEREKTLDELEQFSLRRQQAEKEVIDLSTRILAQQAELERVNEELSKNAAVLSAQERNLKNLEHEVIDYSTRVLEKNAQLESLTSDLDRKVSQKNTLAPVAAQAVASPVLEVQVAENKDEQLPSAPIPQSYVIGSGDVLDISVWKDEALSRRVIVSPDGTFSYPLIGQIRAEGKTVSELKNELEKKISRYVPDPVLYLEVQQANSLMIYVLGRVNRPGRYAMSSNISVLQALAMAGGLNPYAKTSSIKIMRQQGDSTITYPFNYKHVVKGKNLQENIHLKRGDVVIVP